jgi:hypothetical protein
MMNKHSKRQFSYAYLLLELCYGAWEEFLKNYFTAAINYEN